MNECWIKCRRKNCYKTDGALNNAFVAEKVFLDKSLLEKLNALVHPVVRKHFESWMKRREDAPYVIGEAAILFESGGADNYDKVISVSSKPETRIKRVMKRDNTEQEKVEARINNQMNEQERNNRSDFVIYNDDEHLIIPQILKIHEELMGRGTKG